VINLTKNSSPDLSGYRNVVIGGGVRIWKVYEEALRFVEKNDFGGKRVAIFISSVEPREEAMKKYVGRILEDYPHLKPVAAEVFGGRMKSLGRTAVNKRDIGKVKTWAEELGRKFTEWERS